MRLIVTFLMVVALSMGAYIGYLNNQLRQCRDDVKELDWMAWKAIQGSPVGKQEEILKADVQRQNLPPADVVTRFKASISQREDSLSQAQKENADRLMKYGAFKAYLNGSGKRPPNEAKPSHFIHTR